MSTLETTKTPSQPQWDRLPDKQTVARTIEALKSRGINAKLVGTQQEALRLISGKIPERAEVMTGASASLDQIGFTELLKSGRHHWKNLKEEVMSEKDPVRQRELRVEETGEVVVASASGSQIPAYAFNARNVIWVVGTQKIVRSLEEALRRIREHALPLETARMKSLGYPGSMIGKLLILERELTILERDFTMVLVNEKLGF